MKGNCEIIIDKLWKKRTKEKKKEKKIKTNIETKIDDNKDTNTKTSVWLITLSCHEGFTYPLVRFRQL